jgi:hypothetical protein
MPSSDDALEAAPDTVTARIEDRAHRGEVCPPGLAVTPW